MDEITKRFRCLRPCELIQANDDALHASAETLALTYKNDLSSDFLSQLLSFRKVRNKKY